MNDLTLYERIPKNPFPIHVWDYSMGNYNFAPHWHEHLEIHFIFDGTATIKCNNNIIELKKHDCAVINSNELHESVDGRCSYGCILLPPEYIADNPAMFKNVCRDDVITEAFYNIYKVWRNPHYTYQASIKGYTYLLLAHLIDNYAVKELSPFGYRMRTDRLEKVNNALQYINENFTSPITTAELADMSHFSLEYFCHIFKDTLGMSVKTYIKSLRIEKAEGLLKTTNMTSTEIALCCGFSDLNYFSRSFRQKNGCTPTEYRLKHTLA